MNMALTRSRQPLFAGRDFLHHSPQTLQKLVAGVDRPLFGFALALLLIGLVMVASTSVAITSDPLFYFKRQLVFALLGCAAAIAVMITPLTVWDRSSWALLGIALALLVLTLIPGVGKEINGSMRWIPMGLINLQVSEIARLLLVLYLAGYLVRRAAAMAEGFVGILAPTLVLMVAGSLLLMQPDLGALVMLGATWVAMLFIGNVRWRWIILLATLAIVAIAVLIWLEPYRMQRLVAFRDPWADPYGVGYQPVQALIAIGRGGWLGVGLGQSVQKLFYLPEAHTDFVFAVYAEEMGLAGVLALLGLYAGLTWRAFLIAGRAAKFERWFAAYLCFGIGTWLALQTLVHIAVNLGRLPPKGLTLPLISYGGSSLLVTLVLVGLLLRASYENTLGKEAKAVASGRKPRGRSKQPPKQNRRLP